MPKKRKPGVLPSLWRFWVWLATAILHLPFLASKAMVRAADYIAPIAIREASRRAENGKKPHSRASYAPMPQLSRESGDLDAFEEKLLSSKSTIGLVLGSRGSGKSALGMRILENVHAKSARPACAIGFDRTAIPSWIKCTSDVGDVPNGSFVLVDEGGITFPSRESMSSGNKILSALLLVARHKDLSVLSISQNSANLEVNAIRQADYLLLRKPSLLQREFERKSIGRLYDKIAPRFAGLGEDGRHATYIYSEEFCGFVSNMLPSFWSLRASKSFAEYSSGKSQD